MPVGPHSLLLKPEPLGWWHDSVHARALRGCADCLLAPAPVQIKGSVGVKIMQKSYQDSLVLNVRAHLRWTKDLRHLGLYCALLLKVRAALTIIE